MSKILVKLVDEAIIPSLLLVLAKIGGLYISIILFDLKFNLIRAEDTQLFPFDLTFSTTTDLMIANTISNLLMLSVAIIGFIYLQYKIYRFQDKRISPSQLINLADKNLLKLTESTWSVYLKTFVWTAFLWIATVLTTISVFKQEAHVWSAVIALIAGTVCTLFLVKNIEIDYTESNKNLSVKHS